MKTLSYTNKKYHGERDASLRPVFFWLLRGAKFQASSSRGPILGVVSHHHLKRGDIEVPLQRRNARDFLRRSFPLVDAFDEQSCRVHAQLLVLLVRELSTSYLQPIGFQPKSKWITAYLHLCKNPLAHVTRDCVPVVVLANHFPRRRDNRAYFFRPRHHVLYCLCNLLR